MRNPFTDLAYKLFTWETKEHTLKIYIKKALTPTAYRREYWLQFSDMIFLYTLMKADYVQRELHRKMWHCLKNRIFILQDEINSAVDLDVPLHFPQSILSCNYIIFYPVIIYVTMVV